MTESIDLIIEDSDAKIVQNRTQFNNSISLFKGLSGFMLYSAYMYEYKKDEKYLDFISESIVQCLEMLDNENVMSTYCNGYCGFGWTINFLYKKNILGEEVLPLLTQLDDLCIKELVYEGKRGNFDFLHGAFGFLHYLNERGVTSNYVSQINEFIDDFLKYADKHEHGITQICHPEMIPFEHRGLEAEVFGLAHGSAAYIIIFSNLLDSGFSNGKIKNIIMDMITNTLSKRYGDTSMAIYPGVVTNKTEKHYGNISWCYGEIGIAYALQAASRVLGIDYTNEIDEIINKEQEVLTKLNNYHIDSCLCHGFIGNSLLYYNLNVASGRKILEDISDYWFRRGIENYITGGNKFLFRSLVQGEDDKFDVLLIEEVYDLLDGLLGATLCSLTVKGKIDSNWTSLILI